MQAKCRDAPTMTLQPWMGYALGMVIVALGLLVKRRGHYVRARDVHGSVVAGEVNGSVAITNTENRVAAGTGDRIAWAIGIVGVLITAAQFAHDAFGFPK
jgi:hypothetical protein